MVRIVCPEFGGDRRKKPFTPTESDRIQARYNNWQRVVAAAKQTPRSQDLQTTARHLEQEARRLWTMNLADLQQLNPQRVSGLQDLMAAQFGQLNRLAGLNPSLRYSIPGEVRRGLWQAKSVAEGLINVAGRIVALGNMQRIWNEYDTIARGLGLNYNVRSELFYDIVESGMFDSMRTDTVHYMQEVLGRNQPASHPVDMFLRRRYQGIRQRFLDAGFSPEQFNSLANKAQEVTDSFDRVAAIARSMGVDVGNIDGIRYMPRIFTPDGVLRMKDIEAQELLQTFDNQITEFSTLHNRSRTTNYLVPEDLALTSDLLGISPTQIMDLLNDPATWTRYLHDNLSVEQMDALVDSGIMQKLPMTGREVFNYFVNQYDLPYRYMNEMFILEPERLLQEYTNSLQRSAGNSAMLRRMVEGDEPIRAGWAITREQFRSNPEFRNFVPLGDALDQWAVQARITSPSQALGVESEFYRGLSNLYVHPTVAQQFRAIATISMDPNMMGTVGQIAYGTQRWFNRRVLGNVRFVTNTLMQSVTSLVAAGGNLLLMPSAMMHVQRAMTQGLEAFDDMPGRYVFNGQEWTVRQLFERFMITTGHNIAPASNMLRVNTPTLRRSMLEGLFSTPESVGRTLSHLIDYTMASGDPVNGRYINMAERFGRFSTKSSQILNSLLDAQFGIFAFSANYFEIAAKWAMTLSVVENANNGRFAADRFFQGLTSGQARTFQSFDDVLRHMDEYFYNPYNIGRSTSFVNNYVKPFASWAMVNPFMQFRHLARNPHLFVSFQRLRSFWNTPLYSDEDYNNDTVSGWILKDDPLWMGYDEDGNPIVLMPNAWDATQDAFTWAATAPQDFRRAWFGTYEGLPEEQRTRARSQRESFEEWLVQTAGEMNIVWRTAVETTLGRDWTGRPFTQQDDLDVRPSFLGLSMPPRLINILRKVPMLESLDRINPGGVFGVAPTYDELGRLTRAEEPSVFGAARSRVSSRNLDNLSDSVTLRAIRLTGLNVRTIDYARNAQTSLSDIDRTISSLERSINEARVLLESRPDLPVEERNRIIQERDEKISLRFQLGYDKARVEQWMRDSDVLPRDVLRELNRLRIQVRELPDPNQQTIDQLIRDSIMLEWGMDSTPELQDRSLNP